MLCQEEWRTLVSYNWIILISLILTYFFICSLIHIYIQHNNNNFKLKCNKPSPRHLEKVTTLVLNSNIIQLSHKISFYQRVDIIDFVNILNNSYALEDLPGAMDGRDEWSEREPEKSILATKLDDDADDDYDADDDIGLDIVSQYIY